MGFFSNIYVQNISIGNNVTYLNNSMYGLFLQCYNFNSPVVIPNSVTNIGRTFYDCRLFNQPIGNIPSGLTFMAETFYNCSNFNQPIGEIPSGVTSLYHAFNNCQKFNQPIGIPSAVTNTGGAFNNCIVFNQPVGTIPNTVNNMAFMFGNCREFNQPVNITNGCTTNVNMAYMFYNCWKFNQPITVPSMVNNMFMMCHNCQNMGSNIVIYANNVYNLTNMIYNKPSSKRINIFCPSSLGNTYKKLVNSSASYSILGKGITWTNDPTNYLTYNTGYGVYVYFNLEHYGY